MKEKASVLYQYLFIALGFTFPISVAFANVILLLIFITLLFQGDFKTIFSKLSHNKLALIFSFYLFMHIIGLLYTSDLNYGLQNLQHMLPSFFLPLFLVTIKDTTIKKTIIAFSIAMLISAVYSLFIVAGILHSFAGGLALSPFTDHVVYGPTIAFASIIVLDTIFRYQFSRFTYFGLSLVFIIMSMSVFLTDGRAGQLAYILLLILFLISKFKKNIKYILLALLSLTLFITLLYNTNNLFKTRTNAAIYNATHINSSTSSTSTGVRIAMAINSYYIIKQSPIIGLGTASFLHENQKVNAHRNHKALQYGHPHNNYVYIAVEFGLVGLMVLFFLFRQLVIIAKQNNSDNYSFLRYALISLFLLIMMTDIYLVDYITQLLFIIFVTLFFKKESVAK